MEFCFPNVSNEGEYDYLSQTINLFNIEQKHIAYLSKREKSIEDFRYLRTIYHEITHYLDNISTLSGLELLLNSQEALTALELMSESEMYKIVNFSNSVKKTFHNDYYKIIFKKVQNSNIKEWSFSSSVGLRYNRNGKADPNLPIIFTRFLYDGQYVARIPLSLEVIWECNALATEILLFFELLKHEKEDTALVELSQFQSRMITYLYNSENLEYSAAVHFISKYICRGDILSPYSVMNIISGICSNLPAKYYNQLKVPNQLSYIDGGRLKNLKRNKDVGLLFMCLIFNFYESMGENYEISHMMNHEFLGEHILKFSNLPSKNIIQKEVIDQYDKLVSQYNKLSTSRKDIVLHLEKGRSVLERRGIFNDGICEIISRESFINYPIVTLDDFESELSVKSLKIKDEEKRINEFINACAY